MEGIGFSRAWRFQSVDNGPSVVGSVFRPAGGRESWIAIVDDTKIKVAVGGPDIATREAIRYARLHEDERIPVRIIAG